MVRIITNRHNSYKICCKATTVCIVHLTTVVKDSSDRRRHRNFFQDLAGGAPDDRGFFHVFLRAMNPATNGFLLSLSLCLDIGIANIAMMNLAMQRGYWMGFWLGLGSCFGDLIYAVLALAGMTALLQFSAVRWCMWLGGSVVLAVLAVKMIKSAFASARADSIDESRTDKGSPFQQLLKGALLALSSPSAIVWFAAVGGSLIAQSGVSGWQATGSFLGGFFAAGLVWTGSVCFVARQGGKRFGARGLSFCYFASAALFAFFAFQVVTSGYRTLIVGAAA
jgi:L-lysine exporter family protein LysE/ArgO